TLAEASEPADLNRGCPLGLGAGMNVFREQFRPDWGADSMPWLLATKKGGNDPKHIAHAPCSTAGAPNGQSRLNRT
ncbi:MAG: hypothetical protein WEK74_07575, partial [Hydrogenophaga sp.]